MENPIHIFRKATGTHQSGHGLQNIKNGVSIGKQHATILSAAKITLSENRNVGLLTGIGVPILSSSCPTSQDGVLLHCDDSTALLPSDKTALLSSDFIPTSEFESVAAVDVQKVDEWLKGRSDNVCNAITYEFDSEMKATQEDIFSNDRCLLEDMHLNLASKDQLESVAELLDTESISSDSISKQKLLKISDNGSIGESGLSASLENKLLSDVCNLRTLSSKEIDTPATYSSPYIVDSSQLDLVEVPENPNEPLISDLNACKEQVCKVEPNLDNITTVSIQPESKDFVLISIKTGTNEQVFRVKSSMSLDPNQVLTLQNLVSQPVILNPDEVSSAIPEPEAAVPVLDDKPTLEEPQAENVEVSPWIPSISRIRGKLLSCPYEDCDMHFTKETKLRIHVLSHNANRPHKCTFADCDWAFSSEYRLKRHLFSHMGKKNYTCRECNHCFTTKYNLKSHEVLHQRPQNIICPTAGCGKTFATRRKMEFHLKDHQDIDAPYKCPFVHCGKRFYSANYLSSHLRGHQYSKEDLSCPIEGCGRSFARICQLRQHMRQHTGERPYVCDFPKCGWKFSSASKLTRHVRKHTGERKYVCPEPGCNKSFMRPEHLKGHVVVHSGGKPFVCEYPCCNARFTAKSSLYVHMKKHTADGSKAVFPCPIVGCNKKYNFKAHFRAHMLKVHAYSMVQNGTLDSSIDGAFELEDEDGDLEPAAMGAFEDQNDQEVTTVSSELTMVATPSADSTLVSFPESGTVADVPQLIIPENLGKHLSPDLLALASEGQLTVSTSETGQILINPADLLATAVNSVPDQTAHSLLSDMDQLLLGVEEGSPAVVADITANSSLDAVSGVLSSGPAIEVADGGSARTDYSSNLILSSRAKRRRQLQQQFREQELGSGKCDADLPPLEESSGMLSAADVVLSSSSISLRDTEIAPPLLPDDSPSTSDIYPDDAILTSELPSLLSESSAINPDSGIFVVPTIHLSDLV